MESLRLWSVITLISFCYYTQVRSNEIKSFCISDKYIMQSYVSTHTSLDDSEFEEFLHKQHSCQIPPKDSNFTPTISVLNRNITGEGSHRHLQTSINLHSLPQFHQLIIIERLPLGVFADPFELQNLKQRKGFKDITVFGDTNLELPSFRSNRSVVEIHIEINHGNDEISLRLPLHARYQSVEESGYSKVEFGEPDMFLCKQSKCVLLSVERSEIGSVVWEIPSGIRDHIEIVSFVTFAVAVLSAFAIVVASV